MYKCLCLVQYYSHIHDLSGLSKSLTAGYGTVAVSSKADNGHGAAAYLFVQNWADQSSLDADLTTSVTGWVSWVTYHW